MGVAAPLQDFVRSYIHSIEQLEVLLFLRERAPTAATLDEINGVIRSSAESVLNRLRLLVFYKLVAGESDESAFRYSPEDPAAAALIDELAVAYRQRRRAVIELIYAQPLSALKDFSSAFVIKGKRDDE